jgi:hypothetical protein
METGRKFWLTLAGIGAALYRPEASDAVAAMVLAFNGANATVEWAWAKKKESQDTLEVKRTTTIEGKV